MVQPEHTESVSYGHRSERRYFDQVYRNHDGSPSHPVHPYAHEKAKADCETTIDILLMDGERLPGGIKAVHLPGSSEGETAYYAKSSGGIVLLGDTLMNQNGKGLALWPDAYIEDKKEMLKSLQKLLELDFKIATFAHGDPIVQDAKKAIARFAKKPKKNAP